MLCLCRKVARRVECVVLRVPTAEHLYSVRADCIGVSWEWPGETRVRRVVLGTAVAGGVVVGGWAEQRQVSEWEGARLKQPSGGGGA